MRNANPNRLISDLIAQRRNRIQQRKLRDALADPHLARDIGLPHQPRAPRRKTYLW